MALLLRCNLRVSRNIPLHTNGAIELRIGMGGGLCIVSLCEHASTRIAESEI
jgi:hypothetical protein